MTDKEKKLFLTFLEDASDNLSGNTCNDVDDKVWKGWKKSDRINFVKEFHEWNGDPEEFDKNNLHLPDFAILDFLIYKLKKEWHI